MDTSEDHSLRRPLYRRKVFKSYEYLVEDSPGFFVWKKDSNCETVDPNQLPEVERRDRKWTVKNEEMYDHISWIAMQEKQAITVGAGRNPPITCNVVWKPDIPDTPMWSTDVKTMIGEDQFDEDLEKHLPYSRTINFDGQEVVVRANTAAGLIHGEWKAIGYLEKRRGKVRKAAYFAASRPGQTGIVTSSSAQPAVMLTGVPQPGVPQPGVPQPATLQPATLQPATLQPATLQSATQSATQPTTLQPATLQSATQSATQPTTLQPATLQSATQSATQPTTLQPTTIQPAIPQSGISQQEIEQAVQDAIRQHTARRQTVRQQPLQQVPQSIDINTQLQMILQQLSQLGVQPPLLTAT